MPETTTQCLMCGGEGELDCDTGEVNGTTCDECTGIGRVECEDCGGAGVLPGVKPVPQPAAELVEVRTEYTYRLTGAPPVADHFGGRFAPTRAAIVLIDGKPNSAEVYDPSNMRSTRGYTLGGRPDRDVPDWLAALAAQTEAQHTEGER